MSVDYSETERLAPLLGLLGGVLVSLVGLGACIRWCIVRKPKKTSPETPNSPTTDSAQTDPSE